jgi:hypothetical protein
VNLILKKRTEEDTGHLKETGRIEMVKAIDLNYTKGAVVSFRDAG